MVDKNTIFGGMLTTLGANKKTNCDALGIPWEPKYMLIGDANGTDPVPSASQTRLINQVYRAQLNQLRVSEKDANVLIAELVLPPDVGGWWIRELALEDKDGVFCAVSNVAPSYKPLLEQNSGRNQVVRMHIITNGTSNIQLKIDPSVVLATREYVDSRILEELSKLDIKQSVRAATTANINLVGLQVVDGVSLNAGDRVLVKNQTAAKDNGPYEAAVGAWARAKDADSNVRVTPNLTVAVEAGATQADTIWQLVTDGPIVVGTTALTFKDITDGLARLFSPSFAGNPTAPTPVLFDSSKSLATTEYVKRSGGNYRGFTSLTATTVLTAAAAGTLVTTIGTFAVTMPAVSSMPSGSAIHFSNIGSGVVTVNCAGADTINSGAGQIASIELQVGATLTMVGNGDSAWWASGSAQLQYSKIYGSTSAQFDSSKLLATTEFVKKKGVEWAGFNAISASTVLGIGSVGGAVSAASSTAINITLPSTGLAVQGATILLMSAGAGAVTILPSGADLVTNASGVPVSLVLGQGETALLSRVSSEWRLVGGTAALRHSAIFASSLGVTGWRRLPSGEIEQWGLSGGSAPNVSTLITFPVAFPTACVNVQLTYVDAGTHFPASRGAPVQVGSFSKTQFYYSHSGTNTSGGVQHFWTARGN
ncbi:phage tail protein [Pseudomonas kielensis]|uniref:phage tail protein n=1 Tax=Pseudomonas kielensis TaxID=2762577 RepID=UPI00389E3DC8